MIEDRPFGSGSKTGIAVRTICGTPNQPKAASGSYSSIGVERPPAANADAIAEEDASILRVAGGSREWDRVAQMGEARHVGEGAPGESRGEAEARVRHRAVAAQVVVPGVVLLVDAALGHAPVWHLELAAADDLADPRRQHVHRPTVRPSSFTRI